MRTVKDGGISVCGGDGGRNSGIGDYSVIESPAVPVVVVVEMLVALNVGLEELMGGVTLFVNIDGMIIIEKALRCLVEVEVFLRVLLGTMEEAVTLVIN